MARGVTSVGCMRGVRNAVAALFVRKERSTKRETAPVLSEWDAEEEGRTTAAGVFTIAEDEDDDCDRDYDSAWGWTVYHDAATGVRRPILSKVSFSVAYFASVKIAESKGMWTASTSLFVALVLYIGTRVWLMEHLEPTDHDSTKVKCIKCIAREMVEMNWTVAAFVLGDQFVELFMAWNVHLSVDGWFMVAAFMNTAIVLLLGWVEVYRGSKYANAGTVDILDSLVDRVTFAVTFYAASVIEEAMGPVLAPAEFLMGVVVFGALAGVSLALFDLVQEDSLAKRVAKKDWTLATTTIAFVLADVFTTQLRAQWMRAEHVLLGAAWSNFVFMVALYLTLGIAQTHSDKLLATGSLLDRALFAVAVMLASRANTESFRFNEWEIFWLLIGVILLNGEITGLFALWRPKEDDEPRQQLKRLWERTFGTWGMIAMSLAVKFLVDAFVGMWVNETDDPTGIVRVVRIEATVALLIGTIYTLGSAFESV